MKNWWYYHKWYVICGVTVIAIAIHLIGNAFGLWTKEPDYEIAYVGKTLLSEDEIHALEQAFISVSEDFNGDGSILVQVNQYVKQNTDEDLGSQESVREELEINAQISDVKLIGDIMDCESYFFLMDDPVAFQKAHQLLAMPDGSCPSNLDFSVEDKVIPWTGDFPVSNLYLGRRCFYEEKQCKNTEECSALWDKLSKEALQ